MAPERTRCSDIAIVSAELTGRSVHTVSREELYIQVWSKPMMRLAAEYGVTGTALKKTCTRHQIPTPPLGYWAKLEHGKPVAKPSLPKVADPRLEQVRIVGNPALRLPESVRSAGDKARQLLDERTMPASRDQGGTVAASDLPPPEPKILAATRRAISRARPDGDGFASVRGHGIVPLKIAPDSLERALSILSRLLALAETQGHEPRTTEKGFELAVDGESIAFGLEEQPQKTPHQPTAAELKRREERARWGYSTNPWPKYDHAPSGRLAIIIDANPYSGIRRTYSDRKTRTLEQMLPDVLAGFAEHAAFAKERRREHEERARAWKEAEDRRHRQEAFEAREKRRMEFIDAVHEQLVERAKLSTVLSHLESAAADNSHLVEGMVAWIRRRLLRIDALISPSFLEISSRSAKVSFEEPRTGPEAKGGGYPSYLPIKLEFWSMDHEKGLARAVTALEWAIEAGLAPDPNKEPADLSS